MNSVELAKYRQAGKIASGALGYGLNLIRENVSALEVAESVEAFIVQRGAGPAFPVNISINNIAAHYTPRSDDTLRFEHGDVVSLDVGAHVDGYIGDIAATIEVSTNRWQELICASREALSNAVELIGPGVGLTMLGAAIESTIKAYGFRPISNLTGHSLDRYILHSGKSVPNISKNSDALHTLEVGDVLAIEPFATNGGGKVHGGSVGNIYKLVRERPVKLASSQQLLDHIKQNFNTLPFAERWVKFPEFKNAVRGLLRAFVLMSYPILSENDGTIVTQAEHTVLVTEDGCEILA